MDKDQSDKDRKRGVYKLSDDERAGVLRGLKQADRGELVPDEVMTAFFNKYRA